MQAPLLNEFVDLTYTRNPGALTAVSDFVGGFRTWLQGRGHKPPTRAEIIAALLEAGFIIGGYRGRDHIAGISIPARRGFELHDGKLIPVVAPLRG